MKPFKISNQSARKKLWWLSLFSYTMGIAYFSLAVHNYINSDGLLETVVNIIIGILWGIIGYFQPKWQQQPDILLNDEGITIEENGISTFHGWESIQAINLTNNTISLHLENGQEEEIKILTAEHKDLQKLKERLQEFTAEHNVSYASKY